MAGRDYQLLYEQHAQRFAGSEAIGDGDYDAIGRGELELLQRYGLQPHHALLDFGCGIGRLAQFAIPYLSAGQYTGMDISPTMIRRAIESSSSYVTSCKVNWIVQADEHFNLADDSFDMVCAFSVFTHMEHEDTFRYLKAALRIVKPQGLFLFTCLPVDRYKGEQVFLGSASMTLAERWSEVRNVTTSMEMMLSISRLAGWHVVAWEPEAVGQSLCVLRKPDGTEPPALLLAGATGSRDQQISALRLQLAERDRQIQALQAQMGAITRSSGWALLQIVQRTRFWLAPSGSRREATVQLAKRGLYVWRREGFIPFARRAFGVSRKLQRKIVVRASEIAKLPSRLTSAGQLALELVSAAPPGRHQAAVDIVVCVHNALADVKQCLESIVRYTHPPYSLILIDDGSDADTQTYLQGFASSQGALLVRNEQAKGYTFAANQGLARSTADYLVLLNSDTVVTLNWLDRMIGCAESDPCIGLVGPLSNSATWQSIPEVFRLDGDWEENKLPEGITIADMGMLVGKYSGRLYPRPPFLNGFCLMIKRQVIQQIGHFDEDTFGKGYGEENDYCLRALKAGWQLAVADDAFIYHAQSRSYSHERRKQLTAQTDQALTAKHGQQIILDGIDVCRHDRVLEGLRARARVIQQRERFIREGKERWEGKRVLFLLPLIQPTGGGYIVFQEAEAMVKMGVDVRILNLLAHRQVFERSHPDLQIPVMYWEREGDLSLGVSFDGILATAYNSVAWLGYFDGKERPARGYYIQDFEPYYFKKGSDDFQEACKSYTLYDDLIRIAKTEWDREIIREQIGVDSYVGGPTVDIDLCRPRRRRGPDWPRRPLRVVAMIRPSTPWRAPELTMHVLKRLAHAHASAVEIILFGCRPDDPAFLQLPHDFAWHNAGVLTRSQVAALLNEIDIFTDFSVFQAQGLTAMEAMACGAAVVVPENGGAKTFVKHEENGIVIDSHSPEACLAALERLVTDEPLRARLQRQALFDICSYFPERGAYHTLEALFHSDDAGHCTC